MVDNYYEEAQKRGLQVDHKIPIARGGPSNAPWNLGLMNPKDNAAKAERIGGNFKYQPFLADGAKRFPVKGLGGLIPFVGVGFDALDRLKKNRKILQKTMSKLDVAQAAIANVTAATAPIPEPVSQSINFFGGTVNFVIDALKHACNTCN